MTKGRMFMLRKTLIYAIKIFKICFKICLIKRHYMPKKCTKHAQKYNYIPKKCVKICSKTSNLL